MALSSTATLTSPTLQTSTSQVTSQGNSPVSVLRFSPSDLNVSVPNWHEISEYMLEGETSRGRENELSEADTGTASFTLDDRDRRFEPLYASGAYYPNVKLMRRIWWQVQWEGVTYDRFKGFVTSWGPQWPDRAINQETTVRAVDGKAILALAKLPVTDPPRDTYADVVLFDKPYVYYQLAEPAGGNVEDASGNGRNGTYQSTTGGIGHGQPSLVTGDALDTSVLFAVGNNEYIDCGTIAHFAAMTSSLTVECLWKPTSIGANMLLISGPADAVTGVDIFTLKQTAANKFAFAIELSGTKTATGTSTVIAGNTYHLVGRWDGATAKIYVNGIEEGSLAATGTFNPNPATTMRVALTANGTLDEVSVYERALDSTRINAHYNAAFNRGYGQETSGSRITRVAQSSLWGMNKVQAGSFNVLPVYFAGKPRAGEIEAAAKAEGPDSVFFFDGAGDPVFLGRDYRSSSPYNAAQTTLDDDGTDTAYEDLSLSYDESKIFNTVNVTREGGLLQTASDTTSQNTYYERVNNDYNGVILVSDSDALSLAQRIRDRYAEPVLRSDSVTLDGTDPDQMVAMLAREVGDCVRILRRPKNGTAIDQTSYIQKLTLSAPRERGAWKASWSVSAR